MAIIDPRDLWGTKRHWACFYLSTAVSHVSIIPPMLHTHISFIDAVSSLSSWKCPWIEHFSIFSLSCISTTVKVIFSKINSCINAPITAVSDSEAYTTCFSLKLVCDFEFPWDMDTLWCWVMSCAGRDLATIRSLFQGRHCFTLFTNTYSLINLPQALHTLSCRNRC
jgi:hypothetical protein